MTRTVLIVDDSKLARIVLAKAIAGPQPGWTRLEAGDAEAAVATCDRQAVDVAIIDFNMPRRNGLALASELRDRFPDMPLALATANIQDDVISEASAINVAFIPKPVTQDGMRGFISGTALRLDRQLSR